MSIWLGLKAAARSADSSSYLTDNLRGEHSWGYLRASNFKSRLAHMDQLHVDLWWRGLNLAQDAGTCSYNGDPPWDNPLVATRVHNTVLVDGRDQMTRAGRFLVLDWAGAYAKPVIELDERVLCRVRAHFGGYRSLGVRHERSVTVYRDDLWRVEDRLVSFRRRPHTYRLHWLLPDWEWELEETGLGARLGLLSPHGRVTLQVDCSLDVERKVSLVRAGEVLRGRRDVLPFEGWASRTYGEKSPALSLAFEVTSPYHMLLTSEFSFPPCGPAPGAS
jgi:asparagine synthase (glutamine-hydrolysing)